MWIQQYTWAHNQKEIGVLCLWRAIFLDCRLIFGREFGGRRTTLTPPGASLTFNPVSAYFAGGQRALRFSSRRVEPTDSAEFELCRFQSLSMVGCGNKEMTHNLTLNSRVQS
jgi:hypothetical protein